VFGLPNNAKGKNPYYKNQIIIDNSVATCNQDRYD
jgi:hypothetical protein